MRVRNSKIHFQIAATFIGAVMGAGFASGQEMMQFFVVHGHAGLWGTMVAGVLMAAFGSIVLVTSCRWGVRGYQQLFDRLLGKVVGRIFDVLVTLFIFMCFCIMLSASAALFHEQLDSPAAVGVVLTATMVLLALLGGIGGVVWINSVLIPLKFVICFLVSGLAIHYGLNQGIHWNPLPHPEGSLGCGMSMVLYASYNLLLATVVLASLGEKVKEAGGVAGGVAGGLLLGMFGFAISRAMVVFYPDILLYEVPMLFVAGNFSPFLKYLYTLLLWFGILTTAVASAYGFSQRVADLTKVPYRLAAAGTVVLALPMARYSFSFLVATVYPIFGYIGLLFLAVLLWRNRPGS